MINVSHKICVSIAICCLSTFASIGFGQPPPPPAAARNTTSEKLEPPSLAQRNQGDVFRSWEGRFAVSLPTSALSAYSPVTPKSGGGRVAGGQYKWTVKEGSIYIEFRDFLDQPFSGLTSEQQDRVLASGFHTLQASSGSTSLSEEPISSGTNRGRQIKLRTKEGQTKLGRAFIVGDRMYFLLAAVQSGERAEELMEKALDSFHFLEQREIDSEVARAVKASTPKPLPQSPVAPKDRTDAQDVNISGRVKTIVEEVQDLSGTWRNQFRHRRSEQEFNEKGNLVRRISYDSSGYPFEIYVYGYVDGARVSAQNLISRGSGFTTSFSARADDRPRDNRPRDNRFNLKYLYKYSAGRLTETQLVENNGDLSMRYTYTNSGGGMTELVYSGDGKLNQKYSYKYDDRGNPIQYNVFDAFREPDIVTESFKYRYDLFDEAGNWTQRTQVELVAENGVAVEKPSMIEYRTLTYFP